MPKIIGQCNTADFKSIEHLALALEDPAMLDLNTLTGKQILAFFILAAALKAGIKFQELLMVKVILFWDSGHLEWKFYNVPGARDLMYRLNEPAARQAFEKVFGNLDKYSHSTFIL